MKKKNIFFIIITIISIIIIVININNMYKGKDYYIGKIDSINYQDGVTTVTISPTSSNRYFISEINSNHQIEFTEDVIISGISDPSKKSHDYKMGELHDMIDNLAVGDKIIFKVKSYNENHLNLKISGLAVDYTIE